jgi:BNR repeat protein
MREPRALPGRRLCLPRTRTGVLMHRRATATLLTFVTAVSLAAATTSAAGTPSASLGGHPAPLLIKVSHDPYTGGGAQHATEAEPDTYAVGKTVVSVFQTGRYADGGSVDTGWATSTDKGKTWTHGFLPGITVAEGGPWERVSDPAVVYDAKHQRWLVSGLVIGAAGAAGVMVSGSSNGTKWDDPVMAVGNDGKGYDKEWITCDNTPSSPHYGNCYVEVDVTSSGNLIVMSTSKDGGQTWGTPKSPSGNPSGLGGQPLVQPDGTVVVPYSANFGSQNAFRSTDGGSSWTSSVLISNITDHEVPGMREEPLPSAEMNAAGKIYVVWDDCRFRSGCTSNDIVMSTSTDGVTWSAVTRIPIDGLSSGRDHFDPGIGASPDKSGKTTMLGLYYYFYPDASCAVSDCKLDVGYVSSTNDGKTWSKAQTLAGPMSLSWLAQAGGAMVGDYISCSVIGKTATSVFAVGKAPKGSTKKQDMYTAGPLTITGGTRVARTSGVRFTQSPSVNGRSIRPAVAY